MAKITGIAEWDAAHVRQMERVVRDLWGRRSPYSKITVALNGFARNGRIAPPEGMGAEQTAYYERTHQCMLDAAKELRTVLDTYQLNSGVWQWILRGGVAWRILSTPVDDQEHIRIINAMRGERRPHHKPVVKLWEQLPTPSGHAQASMAFLAQTKQAHGQTYKELGLDMYKDILEDVLPSLRRTTKPNQDPRHGC